MFVLVNRSSIEPVKSANRGGIMHVLLSPANAGTTNGIMGSLTLIPGEVFLKHYHPYSDEHVYILNGEITIESEEQTLVARAEDSIYIPKQTPHRLRNTGTQSSTLLFFCSPLAPSPDKGHMLLEDKAPENKVSVE